MDPTITRHDLFYDEQADFVIRAESTLFRLSRLALQRCSVFFEGMFLSGSTGTQVAMLEGTSDEHPYFIPDCPATHLAHLCAWMNPITRPAEYDTGSFEYNCALFTLGRRLVIQNAEATGRKGINDIMNNLTEARTRNRDIELKIYALAIHFDERDWYLPLLKRLLMRPASFYTVEDVGLVGLNTVLTLLRAREALMTHRLLLAHTAPTSYHTSACTNTDKCHAIFHEVWWRLLARDILYPDELEILAPGDVMKKLREMDQDQSFVLEGMPQACWKSTYQNLDPGAVAFKGDEAIFDRLLFELRLPLLHPEMLA